MNNKMKKKAILYTLSLSAITIVSLSLIAFNSQRYNHLDASNTYTLTLDKNNRISEDIVYKDLVFQTDSKSGNVCFRYTDVEALDGYHAYLNSTSKIINKDRMTSITNVLASFEGSLTLKTSLDKITWSTYELSSNNLLDLSSSLPYFIELSSKDNAKLSNIIFTYSCLVNESSAPTTSSYKKVTSNSEITSGDYLIVYEDKGYVFDGSLTTLDDTNNFKTLTITNNEISDTNADKYAFTIDVTKGTIKSKSGYYIGRTSKSSNGLESATTSKYTNTFSISNGNANIISYSTYIRFNATSDQNRFRYFKSSSYTSQKAIQLYKKTETQSVPVTATSISVVDNTSIYYADSIFDDDNQLVVTASTNTGNITLTNDEYTYKVFDSSSKEIDTSTSFPSKGTYTLVVYYQSLTPFKKTFEVKKARELSSITLIVDKTQYKVGAILFDYTSQISALLKYDDNTSVNVSYNSFSKYYLTLTLYQNNVACSFDTAFNSSSTYYLKLTYDKDSSLSDSVNLTIKSMDAWTILIYMCGSDLESDGYLATADIEEILSVSDQPDDINIVIETGGAKKWSSTYNIANNKLSRYYVSNKKLNLIDKLSNASMGATSTFQSFLEWGLKTYPADKTGVIMWNHGGGMDGVCYDEYNSDYLTNAELQSALKTTFTNLNRSEKLEWIGYDACLMQVQDIAETNSQYFNYMVAAQESEAGEGWDYDNWIDDLYAYKDTKTILSEICDTFIADYERNYGSKYANDQTLSVLDLSKMSAYKTSFEKMAKRLYSNYSSIYSTLKTIAASSKNYGEYVDGHTTYKYNFGLFDAKDMLSKMKTNAYFKSDSELIGYINECISQISDIVIHNTIGDDAGNSNGISLFFNYEYYEYPYTANDTNFYYWRLINGF